MATCPKGHTSVATDYCDECGASMTAPPVSTSEAPPAPDPTVTSEPCPECSTPRDGRFCEVCGHDFNAVPGSSPVSETPAAAVIATAWRVVVTADRAYYDRMQSASEGDQVPFPQFCPERKFTLEGSEVLIGRRSRSRGIEPGVDLTGPPEDAGVSHSHALLVATPDGWSVVDLDSANGTYVNEEATPIEANKPVPLAAGDRVHVGAWTTLTLVSA